MKLAFGISPCPNDVWAFAGLLSGAVRVDGVELDFELRDIQDLNESFRSGRLSIAKTSFLAALQAPRPLVILRRGGALGFGVGPILVARAGAPPAARARLLLPGANTTAALLHRLYGAPCASTEQVVFSEILPRLAAGDADFGACIHEGRFVYQRHGLELAQDLGAAWERDTSAPLPLGGIVADATLDPALVAACDDALLASLEWSRAHPDEALALCRRHAQELEEDVLRRHIELYVNARTRDLGEEGAAALLALWSRARAVGMVDVDAPPPRVR
ncbi:MAG: 1,4-dihydroxy-6-naphtoate synthase [Planctomycetota bacterium]